MYGGGLRVTTTIDLGLQELARKAIAEHLDDPDGPEAALVALDPKTGNVLAMVGGRNYRESQFNLAVQGQRQPGSAFKPFVLATALEKGISPGDDDFESKPLEISLGDKLWTSRSQLRGLLPRADRPRDGDDPLRQRRLRAARRARRADDVIRDGPPAGHDEPAKQYFSIGLGTQAANPLELARAYAAFANGGFRIDIRGRKPGTTWNRPRAVDAVEDAEGNVVDDFQQQPRRVLSDADGLDREPAAPGRRARGDGDARGAPPAGASPARPARPRTTATRGSSGTRPSSWSAVWVGYPKGLRPMLTEFHGESVTGGTFPAEIFKTFAEQALPYLGKRAGDVDLPPSDWVAPLAVVQRDGLLQRDNGNCRNAYHVLYFGGAGPKRTANCKPNEVEIPSLVGRRRSRPRRALAAQPLGSVVSTSPPQPRRAARTSSSTRSRASGRASAYDEVKLCWRSRCTASSAACRGSRSARLGRKLGRLQARRPRRRRGRTGRRSGSSPRCRRPESPPSPGCGSSSSSRGGKRWS